MPRKVDSPGPVSDPNIQDKSEPVSAGSFLVEIPLWRFGRIKLESSSQKASLASFALVLILSSIIILSLIECLPGSHPSIVILQERLGQALTLVIGVLLGVDWKRKQK